MVEGIRVRVSGPKFDTLFMVRVGIRVILGYDVIVNTCTGVNTKLQTAIRQISPTKF